MAKSSEYGIKKIQELSDQGDLLCGINKTAVLSRKSADDGGYSYGKLIVTKGNQWSSVRFPDGLMVEKEKCARIGSDQLVCVEAGTCLSIYSLAGNHIRTINIRKKGVAKKPDNISAIAVLGDWVLVAESRRYSTSILFVDYHSGELSMTISIDSKVVGIIPVKPGLIFVRMKEEIRAVDFLSYPRVDIADVMSYGRTLVNTCVKGPGDELYVMFVKGVTPKVLEIHVLDDSYEDIYSTKISHSTSILSLRAVFTTPGYGYLVIQLQNTIFTYKCVDGNRKGTRSREPSAKRSSSRTRFYSEKIIKPTGPPEKPGQGTSVPEGEIKNQQPGEDGNNNGSATETPRSSISDSDSSIGPVLLGTNEETIARSPTVPGALNESADSRNAKDSENRRRRIQSAPATAPNTRQPSIDIPEDLDKTSDARRQHEHEQEDTTGSDDLAGQLRSKLKVVANNKDVEDAIDRSTLESSYIGEEGGEIRSNTYGFSLKIPPGAIPKGQRRKICVGLSRDSSGALDASSGAGGGFSIAPEVICAPSGLELEKPARIKLQHCLSSWSQDTRLSVHEEVAEDGDTKGTGKSDQGNNNARCSLGKDDIELQITRLGKYSVTVMGSEVYKKLACRPFIPVAMPATRRPIINVLIYDHTDGMKKMMTEDMAADSPYPVKPAHIGKNFILNLRAEDSPEVTLTCSTAGIKEEKSMSVGELVEFHSNSVDFQVDCTGGGPIDVTLQLRYGSKKIDMICHVDIPNSESTTGSCSGSATSDIGSFRKVSSPSDAADQSSVDVPSQVLHEIGLEVPHNYYIPLGLKLGLEKAKLDSFLHSCANDYGEATYRALEDWRNREGVDNRAKLKDLLIEADLRRISEMYLS